MDSFGAGKGSAWYKLHPSGLIEMGGAIAVNGSAQAQKITVNYPTVSERMSWYLVLISN